MPSHKVLFFSDVKSDPTHIMIDTVDTIKNKYTVKAYSDVCKAWSIQEIIGRPSTKEYIEYVEKAWSQAAQSWKVTF